MQIDVAIIGGGPSGCSSALSLIARGHSVAILNSQIGIEKPVETAPPEIQYFLNNIGANAVLSCCKPCFGIVSNWGQKIHLQSSMTNPFGHAWFINRNCFDLRLAKIARAKGAAWIDSKVKSIKFDRNSVTVETSNGLVQAFWVVFAAGSPTWVSTITSQVPQNIDSLIAFWTRIPAFFAEKLLFVEASENGWWYSCLENDESAIVCFITDSVIARETKISRSEEWNSLFQKTNLFLSSKHKVFAKSINTISIKLGSILNKYGHRWIAVGDAMAKLDPLGSAGIITALDTGQRAANAVSDAFDCEIKTLEHYQHWCSGLVQEFTRQRNLNYLSEADGHRHGFWARRIADLN
jgi:flavin-dependent dehydrogenase